MSPEMLGASEVSANLYCNPRIGKVAWLFAVTYGADVMSSAFATYKFEASECGIQGIWRGYIGLYDAARNF